MGRNSNRKKNRNNAKKFKQSRSSGTSHQAQAKPATNARPTTGTRVAAATPTTSDIRSKGVFQKLKALVPGAAAALGDATDQEGLNKSLSDLDIATIETALKAAEAARSDYETATAERNRQQKKLEKEQGELKSKQQLALHERDVAREEREKQKQDAEAAQAILDQAMQDLAEQGKTQTAAHAQRLAALKTQEGDALARKRELDKTDDQQNERETDLLARERDRDNNFAEARRVHLADLTAAQETLRNQCKELAEGEATAKKAQHEAALKQRADLDAELDARRRDVLAQAVEDARTLRAEHEETLRTREAALDEAEASLTRRGRELDRIMTDAESVKEELEERIAEASAHAVARAQSATARAESERDDLLVDLGDLKERLRQASQAVDEFGGDPAALKAELDQLKKNNRKLKKELRSRPHASVEEELNKTLEKLGVERQQRLRAQEELARSEAKLESHVVAVSKLEQQQDTIDTLNAQTSALRDHLTNLRRDVADAKASGEARQAFPSCAEVVDKHGTVQVWVPPTDNDLKRFAAEVRTQMAAADSPRYYAPEVVRSFVGGLAANRLLLLEGISGTGKTSLPRSFAQAVGGRCDVVEVQAGWRDRYDLLGQYNTFDKQFMESPMLRALVRANQPEFRDSPYLIVLDEMNLSHPEHYFADFLSVLERDEHRVELVGHKLDNLPTGLVGNSRTEVIIPDNVWFVGTANHDETTKGFADKTYDRSFVMNLAKQSDFEAGRQAPIQPLSFTGLHAVFRRAEKDGAKQATATLEAMKAAFETTLRDIDVGWGSRLDSQALKYIPVVHACGGTQAEAVDHLLTTKLLFKLRGRMDLGKALFETLEDGIEDCFGMLGGNVALPQTQAYQFLAKERARLERMGSLR